MFATATGNTGKKYFALRYHYVADALAKRAPLRAEHLALASAEKEAGRLLMGGAFEPVGERGALLVWHVSDKSEVEAFVAKDPYARAGGIVTSYEMDEWNVVVRSV
jgi:uncharacterized protein YciI